MKELRTTNSSFSAIRLNNFLPCYLLFLSFHLTTNAFTTTDSSFSHVFVSTRQNNRYFHKCLSNNHLNNPISISPSSTSTQTFQSYSSLFKFTSNSLSHHHHHPNINIMTTKLQAKKGKNDDDYDDDDDEIDLSNRDWRAFRAKLVTSENSSPVDDDDESQSIQSKLSPDTTSTTSSSTNTTMDDDMIFEDDLDGIGALFSSPALTSNERNKENKKISFTPLEPSQWAYDSGKVIEQGAVILGGVEQEYGFGLRQQYFHKAVILVLSHDSKFTRGIILNRPSDRVLVDEYGVNWRVWFGGDVQGLDSPIPEIVCLHSIEGDDEVDEKSIQIMKDMKWTTFENAKELVQAKKAKPEDFWVMAGYAGWGPNQLMGELDRKSWYMCATDSQTLLKELAKQSAYTDPRDAGLDTWELLMRMIGREDTVDECAGDFEDLMLKEWAREKLLSVEAGGNAGKSLKPADGVASTQQMMKVDPVDRLMTRVEAASKGLDISIGTLVRASSAERSPFLLSNQEYHKSVVLIIGNDVNVTVGLLLNQPASKGIELVLVDKKSAEKRTLSIPVRFGGQFAIFGQSPLFWLHNSLVLKAAKVGTPIGDDINNIWRCSQEEATGSIEKGLGKPSDFFIVSGLCIWTKGEKGIARGMEGEVKTGRFEIIPKSKVSDVWKLLQKQEVLTKLNLMKQLEISNMAWEAGGDNIPRKKSVPVTDGIGEGYDEEDDSLVFKSDVSVAKLSDDALRSWVATFLLGAPTLGA